MHRAHELEMVEQMVLKARSPSVVHTTLEGACLAVKRVRMAVWLAKSST